MLLYSGDLQTSCRAGKRHGNPRMFVDVFFDRQIERCDISKFQIAESMGFKGEFRQWEHPLRIGD
jgi:hypothetical protein